MDIKLQPVIDFGKMPIANAFLTQAQIKDEYFYDMVLGFDPKTAAIGLVNKVPPEKMFHENYAYFASTSKAMQAHFRDTARKLLPYAQNGLVVEIGSNDGIMLEAWKELGVPALGIDPSKNVAEHSQKRGHDVICDFVNPKTTAQVKNRGEVSLVYGANVSCHIENFTGYIAEVAAMIGRKGVFVFEDPYFLDMVEKTSYDQIYDEHVWYFTVSFINNVLAPLGFQVFDCEHVETHGGGLRMYVGHKDKYPVKPAVRAWLAKETGLEAKLELFKNNVLKSRTSLRDLLHSVKKDGLQICGFGATSKGVIVTNYCGIGPDLIPFITDNTPIKQGKLYPGSHIPIVPQEKFSKDIDVAVLFAWNHFTEIDQSQSWFRKKGGRWLTHVPEPRLI